MVINRPQLVVGSLDEHLDLIGFRLGGEQDEGQELWRFWQATGSICTPSGRTSTRPRSTAYAIAGADKEDSSTPLVTMESQQK